MPLFLYKCWGFEGFLVCNTDHFRVHVVTRHFDISPKNITYINVGDLKVSMVCFTGLLKKLITHLY